MSSNNPLGFLNQLFGSTAAFNNAQHGNTGVGLIDKARPVLDFLGGAYQAHAANPYAGGTAAAGMGSMIEGLSRRNYMNQLQQQQQAALQYQRRQETLKNSNNATIFNKASGIMVDGPFDTGFANNMLPAIRDNQTNDFNQHFLDTGEIDTSRMNPTGSYGGGLAGNIIESAIKRAGEGSDAQATMDYMQPFAASGEFPNLGGQPPVPTPQNVSPPSSLLPNQPATGPQLEMDPTLNPSQGPLQGSASQTLPQYTPANAFTQGVPMIDQLIKLRSNEQGNRLGQGKLAEDTRSNKADEAIGRINAGANVTSANASMLKAKKYQPGGGRAPSITEQMTPEQRNAYFNKLGGTQAPKPLDAKTRIALTNMVATGKNSKGKKLSPQAINEARAILSGQTPTQMMNQNAATGNAATTKIRSAAEWAQNR